MTLKPSPLHFNPLRPSRNQLDTISWSGKPVQRSTDRSPFAYLHDPYVADCDDPAAFGPVPEMGQFNRQTQRWEFPEDQPQMGVYTKTRRNPKSPPTASYPGEQPDAYDYVTDDACA